MSGKLLTDIELAALRSSGGDPAMQAQQQAPAAADDKRPITLRALSAFAARLGDATGKLLSQRDELIGMLQMRIDAQERRITEQEQRRTVTMPMMESYSTAIVNVIGKRFHATDERIDMLERRLQELERRQ